jgi:hypothetical protein
VSGAPQSHVAWIHSRPRVVSDTGEHSVDPA